MLKVAIVENNPDDLALLCENLEKYKKSNNTKILISSFKSAEAFLASNINDYDLAFIDIELDGESGIEASLKLRKKNQSIFIIFVTNMPQYALQGYKVNALDYIIKPITYNALAFRMKQIEIIQRDRIPSIGISFNREEMRLSTSSIYCIGISDHLITFYTEKGEFSKSDSISLKKLEKKYEKFGFARCCSSYLVNLRWVEKIDHSFVYVNKQKYPLSRTMKNAFITKYSRAVKRGW